MTCIYGIFIIEMESLNHIHQFVRIIFNPLTTNGPHNIETSQLICNANQLTGFYMMVNIGR